LLGVGIENADFGTAAISIYAMQHGADVLRVHDVKNNYDVLKMYKRCSSNG
jgi:dihydropteroate synthase